MKFDFTLQVEELIRDGVSQLIGKKTNHSNKINLRCFYCGDSKVSKSKRRGWVYFNGSEMPSFTCWNCGKSTRGIQLAADLLEIEPKDVYVLIANKLKHNNNNNNNNNNNTIIKNDAEQFEQLEDFAESDDIESFLLPNNWEEPNNACKTLLESRKILLAPYKPSPWKFYYCNYTKRLVIPWMRGNDIITYQTRALFKTQYPKYKFQADIDKPVFVVDQNIKDDFDYIFVGEGIFDMIWVKHSVCIGGLIPTADQKNEMNKLYPFHKIVLFPDNYWLDEASKEFIKNVAKKNPNQLVFNWDKSCPAKDINDDILYCNNLNKYNDIEYLKSHIIPAAQLSIKFLFK